MFHYQIIALFFIMTVIRDGNFYDSFSNYNGPRKVIFHPKHWMKKRLLYLFGLVAFMLSR